MASSTSWTEYNGASGATVVPNRTDINWKNVDDSSTVYSSSQVQAGNNSFYKQQSLVFGGTYNSLSALTVRIDSNAPATGISIVGAVQSALGTPSTAATGDPAFSTSGLAVNFGSSTSPAGAGTATYTAGGTVYTQVVRSQVQTTTAAGPGDIGARTITAAWTES
jgi:hypothetical protein